MPSLGGIDTRVPKKRGKKNSEWDIAPGFTGIIENIKLKNPIKVSKSFGVTPVQSRGLLVGKKSKGKYFELTNL